MTSRRDFLGASLLTGLSFSFPRSLRSFRFGQAIWAPLLDPAPGEIFFVADDWPFHARDFMNYLAAQLHAEAPFYMSSLTARLLGGYSANLLSRSARYKTDKIKKMLGWTPAYPTYREGFAEILPALGVQPG